MRISYNNKKSHRWGGILASDEKRQISKEMKINGSRKQEEHVQQEGKESFKNARIIHSFSLLMERKKKRPSKVVDKIRIEK